MRQINGQLHFNSFLGWSILFHCLIFSSIIINLFFFKGEDITYIPAIKVDIVALPDKQAPRKNIMVNQKKALPKVETKKQSEPKLKKAEAPPKPPIKKTQVPAKPQKKQEVTEPSFVYDKQLQEVGQSAIERLKHLEQVQGMLEEEELIKGNRIVPGTALEGLDKLDYDNYIGVLHNHIQSYWELPQWLAVSDNLNTVVKIYLDPNGYVINRELIKSSGDTRFDEIVLTAIDKASPFPKPEDKFIDIVYSGIILTAKP